MIKPVKSFAFLSSLLLFLSCQSGRQDAGGFKFNLLEGEDYTMQMDWDMMQEIDGHQSTIKLGSDYTMLVVDKKDTAVTLKVTFGDTRAVMNIEGINVEVNTATPFNDTSQDQLEVPEMISRMFYAIKSKTFEMRMNQDGSVAAISGLDKLEDAIVASMGMPPEFYEPGRMLFRQQFNDQLMKEKMEKIFFIYPVKAVKPGDTWSKHLEAGGLTYLSHFSVKSIHDGEVDLDVSGSIASQDTSVQFTGRQNGSCRVDVKSGWILQSTLSQESGASSDAEKVLMKTSIQVNGSVRKPGL